MKKKSLKVKVQELAANEAKNTKGGLSSSNDNDAVLKTVTQTGKKQDQSLMF